MFLSLLVLTLCGMMRTFLASACTFPFIYEARKFSSCIANGRTDRMYWCATTRNYDRDKKWEFCPEADLPENSSVAFCTIPFIFEGKKFFSCTTEGRMDGRYWCATTENYDKDGQWILCSGSDYGKVRLVNGTGRCLGRVEIFFSHRWGTVCDSIWGIQAAEVVCRQLGCGHAKSQAGGAHFGEGSGPIWLDSIQCTGAESHLWQCDSKRVGEHSCSHQQDVGVTCEETNIEHKELDEAPDSLYENIEWVRN